MGRCEYCFSSNSTARKKRKRQEQEQEQEHEQTSGHTSGHDRGHTSARWISYNDAIESTQPLLLSTLEQHIFHRLIVARRAPSNSDSHSNSDSSTTISLMIQALCLIATVIPHHLATDAVSLYRPPLVNQDSGGCASRNRRITPLILPTKPPICLENRRIPPVCALEA
jgi:hypothetical protein